MAYNSLVDNGFILEKKYFEYSMEKGGYIILLDGFDEVNRERSDKVTLEIKSICNKYNNNRYIISSRPAGHFIGWNDFAEMTTLALTKDQALSLINKIEFDEDIKKNFINELNEKLYERYQSFASNPLLLTIMLLTYDRHASIPDKLNDFYEQAFTTLFNAHDATKDAYTRDIRTGLGCEDFKLVFSHFCFKSYFDGAYEFTEAKLHQYIKDAKERTNKNKFKIEDFQEDLKSSVCMLIQEGLNYRFSHRSFQEYFAAWYTCKLPDNVQERLLTSWIKESDFAYNVDSFITMLFNMQSEKVNRIVFVPALKQLKREYDKYGFTVALLARLFEGISIRRFTNVRDDPRSDYYALSLRVKNSYYSDTLRLACQLNEYSYSITGDDERVLAMELRDIMSTNKGNDPFMSFDVAVNHAGEKRLLHCLTWFYNQMMFGFSLIDKYADINISRKKKVASILDEL